MRIPGSGRHGSRAHHGDSVTDVNISTCRTTTSQSYAYAIPGTYGSRLNVTDLHGNSAAATVTAIAAGTSTTPATWTTQLGASGTYTAAGITTDATGNTILTGYTYGALPGDANAGNYDIVLAKYLP